MDAGVWEKASNFQRNKVIHWTGIQAQETTTTTTTPTTTTKLYLKKNQTKVYLAEQIPYFGSENQGIWST